jgi:hypothetical protein
MLALSAEAKKPGIIDRGHRRELNSERFGPHLARQKGTDVKSQIHGIDAALIAPVR